MLDAPDSQQQGHGIDFWRSRPSLSEPYGASLGGSLELPDGDEALPPWATPPLHQLRLGTARYEALCLEHQGIAEGSTIRIFTNSLNEFWEDAWELDWARRIALDTMRETPHLSWMILTRRPDLIMGMLQTVLDQVRIEQFATPGGSGQPFIQWLQNWQEGYPPHNVWLGTTSEGPAGAEERLRSLLKVPAALHFLSPDLCCPRTLHGGTTHVFSSRRDQVPRQWLAHGASAEALLALIPELLDAEESVHPGPPGLDSGGPSPWQRPGAADLPAPTRRKNPGSLRLPPLIERRRSEHNPRHS